MFYNSIKVNSKGHLVIGGCDAVELAERFGTPLYVIDEDVLRANSRIFYNALKSHNPENEVVYAGKAFLTTAMCKIIQQEGLGLDVVSGGELYTALKAGFPTEKIYFHGNNKSEEELIMALQSEVGRIIIDNWDELELLEILAKKLNKEPAIYIRVTPGIEAHTHRYIMTGQIDSKFGFTISNGEAFKAVKRALTSGSLKFKGLHCHIGSQILESTPYKIAVKIMLELLKEIKDTLGRGVEELDLGGGFGIPYVEDDSYQPVEEMLRDILEELEAQVSLLKVKLPKIIVEPGRAIIGNTGITLYKVGGVKEIPGVRKYVFVDGGMSDNIRTALYGARYSAVIANRVYNGRLEKVTIAGKLCESGDVIIWDILLPEVKKGDIIAVLNTGAYGYSMASNYNRLPKPAVILVSKGKAEIIVKRETYEDVIKNDVIPERLEEKFQGREMQAI
ncbi:MAG: Diaminopimelate decarboxylase [Caldanaerobacter subterraneus]|uniref:Diaminopimelate decarboxylase n=2 Tax=Caldanaerobacter subterraneus TaxID=911092 RepID=A0A117KVY2_9THEO|nr:diaminopimelate decarboxylase [Caldanaerobacter subterraneus]KKC30776.1 diaminopimelate decarboxylase [Caldanaerobacter subterraneus subsp. pacificus DSM 12653]KUK08905.1 MAG: Diaminopimelate decarboxylase [Caldanaerobacter subterraneus]HBT50239.1 diaminopimelate decarboxylase [Caldanaerobacter subterraneus]